MKKDNNRHHAHLPLPAALLHVVLPLLACLLLTLGACSTFESGEDAPDAASRAYVMLSFHVGSGHDAATRANVEDGGIADVLLEGNTPNEAQVHTALVALFSAGDTDDDQRLEHLFWFADGDQRLQRVLTAANGGTAVSLNAYHDDPYSLMGGMSIIGTEATSTTKALWPGNYHAVVYGNLLSPHLLMQLFGLTSVPDLLGLTQDEVSNYGFSLRQFRELFAGYATGPQSTDVTNDVPASVDIKTQGAADNTDYDNYLGGYADNLRPDRAYYHQSVCEIADMEIPKGFGRNQHYTRSIELKRSLAKIRVNITNIDEAGRVYGGTEDYRLSATEGIVVKNWIPFAPNMMWKDYDITPATPVAYTLNGRDGAKSITGLTDLNVSWMQLDYTRDEEYPYAQPMADIEPDQPLEQAIPGLDALKALPLQYYLSRGATDFVDVDEQGYPQVESVQVLTGAVEGRTSADAGAYNAQLFNCYIAPWSQLFPRQTATDNTTKLQFTFEKRDAAGKPVSGSERVYEIPVFNPDADPVASTAHLMDDAQYLADGDYSPYTILRNYLYQFDIVFRGPEYPLVVTVSINPWNAAGEPQRWTLDDDGVKRHTFEVIANPSAWLDDEDENLHFTK